MATYVQRASDSIPEFRQRYEKFSRILTVRQCASGTVSCYCSKIACLCLHYGKLPEDLSVEEIESYLCSLLERKPTPSSSMFEHLVIALRSYYTLMGFEEKQIALPKIKKKKTLPVVLSEEEVRQLLLRTSDIRQKTILTLLYSLGLRVGELCKLTVADLDMDRMRMHVRQGKGKKDRYIQLAVLSLPLLKRYLKDYHPTSYLFCGCYAGSHICSKDVSAILREAIIHINCQKKVTCHTLRHSFATHSLEMGLSILWVQEFLGHSDVMTTMIYLQVMRKDSERVFNPLDKLFASHP